MCVVDPVTWNNEMRLVPTNVEFMWEIVHVAVFGETEEIFIPYNTSVPLDNPRNDTMTFDDPIDVSCITGHCTLLNVHDDNMDCFGVSEPGKYTCA